MTSAGGRSRRVKEMAERSDENKKAGMSRLLDGSNNRDRRDVR
jgi:hypothetical protein